MQKSLRDESDRGLISCIGKIFKPLDNIRRVASLTWNSSITSTRLVFFEVVTHILHCMLHTFHEYYVY